MAEKTKKKQKIQRPKPRNYKGFRDVFSADILLRQRMIDSTRAIFERYGFSPLETPALEYVDCLGKFLPEEHTPEGGIFSFRNPDLADGTRPDHPDWWLGLRYDLTAPLARVVAQYQDLPKPFRRYQLGQVWRYEKPGPGRFREFYQFDFDTVGAPSMIADAESCAMMCDVIEALGFTAGDYVIQVNDRKALQGALECAGLTETDITDERSQVGVALRAIDKLDRIGRNGVTELLGKGRTDASGDYTAGAGLDDKQIAVIHDYLDARSESRTEVCDCLAELVADSTIGCEGVDELRQIDRFLTDLGYGPERVRFEPTVVRGLGYYTGPVFEGIITREIVDEKGKRSDFGSVAAGGRYDTLVQRFTGQKTPAVGASIGIDRLLAAMRLLEGNEVTACTTEVLITVMDKSRITDYLQLLKQVREAGINSEVFVGSGSIGKQLQYADRRGIPLAVIAGSDEFDNGEYQVKDLELGRRLAADIEKREEWLADRPSQQSVSADMLIATLKDTLAGYRKA